MTDAREAPQEMDPYDSLEDFDRQQHSAPVENLIDLSSVIGESSTSKPSAYHHTLSNNASLNWQGFSTETLLRLTAAKWTCSSWAERTIQSPGRSGNDSR